LTTLWELLKSDVFRRRFGVVVTALTVVAVALLLVTCSPSVSELAQIQKRGTLRVVTINGPTTYFLAGQGETGFDYDVAKLFATTLGVRLKILVAANSHKALSLLRRGKADLAAAAIAITPRRKKRVRFAPPLRSVSSQLVYRQGEHKPSNLSDLQDMLVVEAHSSVAQRLKHLPTAYTNLDWEMTDKPGSEELIRRVARGKLAYTIASSDLVAIDQNYYPELATAFTIGEPQKLAWALRRCRDTSLYNRAKRFISHLKAMGGLKSILNRYFGTLNQLNYVGRTAFIKANGKSLPGYEKAFKRIAGKVDIDWRLLAAQAYQESHWDPDAVSPTGVEGLMMLTEGTAEYLHISDRTDPVSSIDGGARYLRDMMNRLPASIKKPDRVWMALATYNIGLGHLLDARRITKKQGGDPNRWVDVRKRLPLLSEPKWYKKTRNGYARGRQTVQYVGNIRSYYDILLWLTQQKTKSAKTQTKGTKSPAPQKNSPANKALEIKNPAL
jgi:membrane-bound lytic murein transglycosylase F